MEKEIKSLAQQANLFDQYALDNAHTKAASLRRQKLHLAINNLKESL